MGRVDERNHCLMSSPKEPHLASSGAAGPDAMAYLVAPKPQYANAEPLSQFSTNTSAQTRSTGVQRTPEEEKVLDHDPVPVYASILPKLGRTEDSTAALEKLERIQRTSDAKKRWRKGVRKTVLKAAASRTDDGGKEKGIHGRKIRQGDDADSLASSLNLYGEVRLAITSMPGFTVLASKARHALDRADSPTMDGEHGEEGGTAGKGSFSFRFGSRRRSSLVPASDSLFAATSSNVVQAQTEGVPDTPTSAADLPYSSLPRAVAANPELDPLQEERRAEEVTDIAAAKVPVEETATIDQTNLVKPTPIRPRLTVRAPSETDGKLTMMGMVQSPEDYHAPFNPLSNLMRMADSDRSVSEHSPSPGPSDGDALVAAEQCRRMLGKSPNLEDSPLIDDVASSSIRSPYSLSSESATETDDESSDDDEDEQPLSSLKLQHTEKLNRKQQRRMARQLRRQRRQERTGVDVVPGEQIEERLKAIRAKSHRRTGSLTNQISTGLHYASSQSRNRRAMEKFSPNPSRPTSTKPYQAASTATGMTSLGSAIGAQMAAAGSLSRSSTPGNLVQSERSSFSNDDSVKDAGAGPSNHEPTSRPTSPKLSSEQEEFNDMVARNPVRRWGTSTSTASSQKGTLKNRLLSLRRNRAQPSDVPEEDLDAVPRHEAQAEQELDHALGRLIAEEAPEQLGEQFEYDVLYENQRGMLFFGIPKFSAKTLFHWDPAPWTNAYNRNSAYNVVNAQLPNPAWEWVHPEWMIDMSGDVDEAGWQYSYNYGRITVPFQLRTSELIPRANANGNQITNERFIKATKRMEEREAKQATREDDGFEALKRTALSRNVKWSGVPTQNTYVRRRRWIRLRRRKPLHLAAAATHTPKARTPQAMSKASIDWAHVLKPDDQLTHGNASTKGDGLAEEINDQEEGSLASNRSSSSDSELYEQDGRGESDFLPRRTTGDLKSGADPMQMRDTREQKKRRRHAREFSGTIRELKTLLPTILVRKSGRSHRPMKTINERQKSLWLTEVDARNPFICWSFVKRRLADDDLAFPATTLRAYERRHAQRKAERRELERADEGRAGVDRTVDGVASMIGSHAPWEQYELTKDALVEINFRRVLRVMKACKVDRQKIQLWRLWLGLDQLNVNTEPSRNEDLLDLGLAASKAACGADALLTKEELARMALNRWRAAYSPADPSDAWDVIERRLERLLLTFEHQFSRATFLQLLSTVHAGTHPAHRVHPESQRDLLDRDCTTAV